MKACDRCLSPDAFVVAAVFKKYDGSNRQGRPLIVVEMEICDKCITDLLKQFGRFKKGFLKDGDTPET